MSFNAKPTRPDSKDAAKLRAEYKEKVRQMKESTDPASRTKLRDDKEKAFGKLREHLIGERRENVRALQKVLEQQGKFKPRQEKAA